jgi:hypothetical protein
MTLAENIADRLTGGKISNLQETAVSQAELIQEQSGQLFQLTESIQRLEQLLYSPEWRMLTMQAEQEFTREGLRQITRLARIMRLKNPVIKRGVKLQRLYVWAQGASISAADPEINGVIQSFLDDERNRAALTSHQARGESETNLQTDGNLFFRFHINELNGRVRISRVEPQEIDDIICNPEDKDEPWFYRRVWTQTNLDGGAVQHTVYYPDWQFKPVSLVGFTEKLAALGGLNGRIDWSTPVMHTAVNRLGRFGICEFYDANDWAVAYKNFLEQLASVWQALARWAAKLTTKGGKRGVAAAKTKLNTTLTGGGDETNPPPVTGSTFIASEGVDLQPFRTAGATMSAEDGRRLFLMAAMSFGFPETFFGDASVGSLATAKSLDRPTELQIMDRQALHRDYNLDILRGIVLTWAVKAPQGRLRSLGRIIRERDGEEWIETVAWNEGIKSTVTMDFPAIIEHDVSVTADSIIDAVTLKGQSPAGAVPLEPAVRRLLSELKIGDVDEVMELWREEQEERAARAEQMAAQFDGGGGADEEEDTDAEEAWRAQVTAVSNLLVDLREAMAAPSANGHQDAI